MNKLMIMFAVAATAVGAFAGPRGCPGGGCRPCGPCHPRPCGPGWHGPRPCGDYWGPGGRRFWPGFVGGVVGGLAYNALATPACRETVVVQTTPAVVTQPVVVQQPVVTTVVPAQTIWVEGCYVDRVQADGTTVRVWNPGHYEQRTVVQ